MADPQRKPDDRTAMVMAELEHLERQWRQDAEHLVDTEARHRRHCARQLQRVIRRWSR